MNSYLFIFTVMTIFFLPLSFVTVSLLPLLYARGAELQCMV